MQLHHGAGTGRDVLGGGLEFDIDGQILGVQFDDVLAIRREVGHHRKTVVADLGTVVAIDTCALGLGCLHDADGIAQLRGEGHAACVGDDAAGHAQRGRAVGVALAMTGGQHAMRRLVLHVDTAGIAAALGPTAAHPIAECAAITQAAAQADALAAAPIAAVGRGGQGRRMCAAAQGQAQGDIHLLVDAVAKHIAAALRAEGVVQALPGAAVPGGEGQVAVGPVPIVLRRGGQVHRTAVQALVEADVHAVAQARDVVQVQPVDGQVAHARGIAHVEETGGGVAVRAEGEMGAGGGEVLAVAQLHALPLTRVVPRQMGARMGQVERQRAQ